MKILLVGGKSSGKSLLAFTLSRFLDKKGRGVAVINLDPAARALKYTASLDIRDSYSISKVVNEYSVSEAEAPAKALQLAKQDKAFMAAYVAVKEEFVIVDTGLCFEDVLFADSARGMADKMVYIAWAPGSKAPFMDEIARLLAEHSDCPVIGVVNTHNQKQVPQQKLFSSRAGPSSVIVVDALEKKGFDDLLKALES